MSSAVVTAGARRVLGWRVSAFDALRVLAGLLLLAAGVMKGYGLLLGVSGTGWMSSMWVQLLALETDVLFGAWALAGNPPSALRSALVGYFLLLAATAAAGALAGSRSCNCLGPLAVSGWLMLAIDACAVAALLTVRPKRHQGATWFRPPAVLLGSILLVAAVFGIASAAFGSPVAALARLRGEKVTIEPGVLDLGECVGRVKHEARLTVVNGSDEDVTVVGGSATCRCAVAEGLPAFVPAHGSREVIVAVTPVAADGQRFAEVVTLYLDGGYLRLLQGRLHGRAVRAGDSNEH